MIWLADFPRCGPMTRLGWRRGLAGIGGANENVPQDALRVLLRSENIARRMISARERIARRSTYALRRDRGLCVRCCRIVRSGRGEDPPRITASGPHYPWPARCEGCKLWAKRSSSRCRYNQRYRLLPSAKLLALYKSYERIISRIERELARRGIQRSWENKP